MLGKSKSLLCMGAIPIAEKTCNGVGEVVICYIGNNFLKSNIN
jgi:hypothetical protein